MFNRIQNKSLCLHHICVYTVYIYHVYINTQTCMYILTCIYMHMYIYIIHIICKYILYINNIFLKYILYVCVFIYTINMHRTHTHIM